MTDPRFTELASLLVNYSCRLKKGETVLIDVMDIPDEFTVELIRAVRKARATPLVDIRHSRITREILRGTDNTHARLQRTVEMFRMKKVQAYIALRGADNASESSDVPSKLTQLY